jgi:hypothetical protein
MWRDPRTGNLRARGIQERRGVVPDLWVAWLDERWHHHRRLDAISPVAGTLNSAAAFLRGGFVRRLNFARPGGVAGSGYLPMRQRSTAR